MEAFVTDSQMDGGGIIRAVMSFSGGMDSTSLLLRLIKEGYKIDCISFNYGQKHKIEIERASLNISYLRKFVLILNGGFRYRLTNGWGWNN